MFIHSVFLFFSILLTLFFFLYGFNHYYLLNAARHYIVSWSTTRFNRRLSSSSYSPASLQREVCYSQACKRLRSDSGNIWNRSGKDRNHR